MNYITAAKGRGTVQGSTDTSIAIRDRADIRNALRAEAAIGSVDSKQLETLMAHGLSEDEATDMVIEGLLSPNY